LDAQVRLAEALFDIKIVSQNTVVSHEWAKPTGFRTRQRISAEQDSVSSVVIGWFNEFHLYIGHGISLFWHRCLPTGLELHGQFCDDFAVFCQLGNIVILLRIATEIVKFAGCNIV
jgi:hypothetical protein